MRVLALTLLLATQIHAAEIKLSKSSSEQQERDVDQAAMASQEVAISRLNTLLKKYKNTSQEPVFLSKLADFHQQKAAILFRLAHGNAHRSKGSLNLSQYNKMMSLSIETLDRLISKYPRFEEISHAYFMRAKAYDETGRKPQAGKDFLYLVKHFPDCEDSSSAYMSLAEYAIEANDHQKAIGFLKEVEKRPEDPHFPFALYKLAWSYYNLKNIPTALSYAERQITYYTERAAQNGEDIANTSDNALRENTLLDVATFYFEGYEQKQDPYTVDKALDYFSKLEKGPSLGKMFLRFAKLLRSHSHEADLLAWKDKVIDSQTDFQETLDIVSLAYEFYQNKQKWEKVVDCAQDMVRLYAKHKTYESFPKAQKQVLDTAEGLQKLIIKNKGASEVSSYSKVLARVYDAFVHMVEDSDPRIPRVHFNLAETLFTIKDFTGATEHYRWVVDHGKWNAKPVVAKGDPKDSGASVQDASIRAIASRYEELKLKDLIPKELTAQPLSKDSDSDLPQLLGEWVEWIDTHVKHSKEGTENFVFEANRAMYAKRHIKDASERMAKFAEKNPKSKFAIPSASLVLDTYIASANWELTQELAESFMGVSEWKTEEFSKKLFAVAADSFYKQLEGKFRDRDFKGTLKGTDKFLERYSASERFDDTLALAGSAALEAIDRDRGVAYFSRLIKDAPKSKHVVTALLARGTIYEDRYLFTSAAADYRAYIALKTGTKDVDTKQIEILRRKSLMLNWLSGDAAVIKTTLSDKLICNEKLALECERFALVGILTDPKQAGTEKTTHEAFEKARHDSAGENRPIWALIALAGTKHLTFRDRHVMVRHAVNNLDDIDPLVKFVLVPHLSTSLAQTFKLNRAAMNTVAPLKAHEKWITRRVEVIREMENAVTKVMKLPWARIRAETVNELAGVYLDLARGLSALPAPKDLPPADLQAYEDTIRKLTMPFEEKGQDMRLKAFEIASRFAIEDDSMAAISEPFFAENPSQAKALKPAKPFPKPTALDLAFLDEIDSAGDWDDVLKLIKKGKPVPQDLASDNPALYLRHHWGRALAERKLQQVAFFMQEANEKALIQAGVMGAVKALSLAAAGARGEAIAELEETRKDLSSGAKDEVTEVLVQYFQNSYAKKKVDELKPEEAAARKLANQ